MKKLRMNVSNMKCVGCLTTIKHALSVEGVSEVSGDVESKIVDVIYDETTKTPRDLVYLVEKEGYTVNYRR